MVKRMFFLATMASAVAVPYLISSSSDFVSGVKNKFTAAGDAKPKPAEGAARAPGQAPSAAQPVAGAPGSLAAKFQPELKPQSIEGLGVHELAEVLHFDPTPAWVMARWPRVSASLAELDLQGYRVPLVTGTGPDDLAGSLTYYFDKDQHVKYITFHGATGDPRKLIAFVTRNYSFKPESTNDPGLALFLVKWNGTPVSELRIRTAKLLRADQPHSRYEVDLAMKRP